MAIRKCFFVSNDNIYEEKEINFTFYKGFAKAQKQKSIVSLHEAILKNFPNSKTLEISSKSLNILGVKLSAFNLVYIYNGKNYPVENIFQSSKVFEDGGPYKDLLKMPPNKVKQDERLKNSGKLIAFKFDNITYPLEPKTLYYDWIYCNALFMHEELMEQIIQYNCFTDIEFNHKKSINCQARSVAIFVSLVKKNLLEQAMSSIEKFKKIVYKTSYEVQQLSLF